MTKLDKSINNSVIHKKLLKLRQIYYKSLKHRKQTYNDCRLAQADNLVQESWKIINSHRNNKETETTELVDKSKKVFLC